ncbi:hypothetical protein Baya_3708 [Bagarius yarrelli]|uniref:Uncharacterized protein n=1 Tax=Bagarius yarrelli TaxID=175774 RepID=A0A556TSR1_BAGYA|nr:hypothetical protein Baya_3708 [Bagarius yarrelli]
MADPERTSRSDEVTADVKMQDPEQHINSLTVKQWTLFPILQQALSQAACIPSDNSVPKCLSPNESNLGRRA